MVVIARGMRVHRVVHSEDIRSARVSKWADERQETSQFEGIRAQYWQRTSITRNNTVLDVYLYHYDHLNVAEGVPEVVACDRSLLRAAQRHTVP